MFATNQSTRILKPAHTGFILASFALALVLNLLPTRQWLFMPDWVLLVLAFWSVREWRMIGHGSAFWLGLLMDVVDGAAFGQHALAYVLTHHGATWLSRRMLWFSLWQQALHLLPLFLGATGIQIVLRMLAGGDFPGWVFVISPLVSVLLWPLVSFLLLMPQFQPETRDDNRPI
ncbi:MAG: rod shape-determining protein MreD [Zoogloeaceae bacterium]|jgi:rod shape-determining protein MreD|nr:rod shape-determining protein MreD [Zoogloeaceae bacterium]